MPRLIAFLRAINVGGHTVSMAQLRKEFEALGLQNVETFIASGNVIFTSRSRDLAVLEKKIESRLRTSLGYEVATFLRTDAEVAELAAYRPFDAARIASARAFCVGFLDRPLDAKDSKTLMAFKTDIDDFHCRGREVFWLCKKGQGESTFNNVKMEKVLKVRGTFRGLNTVVRLAAKYPPS
jgi:uncharacterized protein (DUF1697 family)